MGDINWWQKLFVCDVFLLLLFILNSRVFSDDSINKTGVFLKNWIESHSAQNQRNLKWFESILKRNWTIEVNVSLSHIQWYNWCVFPDSYSSSVWFLSLLNGWTRLWCILNNREPISMLPSTIASSCHSSFVQLFFLLSW